MRYDKHHKEQTRQLILEETMRELRTGGPDSVGVASLMAKVGLTHGGFYAHFSSREKLLDAAVEAMCNKIEHPLLKLLERKSPAEAICDYIRDYLSPKHRDTVDGGCPVATLAGDISRMDGVAKKSYLKGMATSIDAFAQALHRAGIENAETSAASLFSEMVGSLSLARAIGKTTASNQFLAKAQAAVLDRVHALLLPK